jgi:hypothetical protein
MIGPANRIASAKAGLVGKYEAKFSSGAAPLAPARHFYLKSGSFSPRQISLGRHHRRKRLAKV